MRSHADRPVEADSFRFPRSKPWTVSSKVWTADPDENHAREGLSLTDGENHAWTRMGEGFRPGRPVAFAEDLSPVGRVCPYPEGSVPLGSVRAASDRLVKLSESDATPLG